MKKDKSRIDIYETVYHIDIVVANKYTTILQLLLDYYYSDELELDNLILDCVASCSTIKNKHTDKRCILIKDNHTLSGENKFLDLIDTIAHESMHALLDIYDATEVKIDYSNPEHVCYFIGYIQKCVAKTLFSK